jgi:hypothetical protein
LIGALVGLVAAIVVSNRVGFSLHPKRAGAAIAVPFASGFVCYLIGLNWLFGGAIILIASVISYGRLRVVERKDLREIALAFASEKTVAKAGMRLNWILRIIYGE